jgi:hypothetical protein
LTYKKDNTFKTFYGGISTILTGILILSYFATGLKDIFDYKTNVKEELLSSNDLTDMDAMNITND